MNSRDYPSSGKLVQNTNLGGAFLPDILVKFLARNLVFMMLDIQIFLNHLAEINVLFSLLILSDICWKMKNIITQRTRNVNLCFFVMIYPVWTYCISFFVIKRKIIKIDAFLKFYPEALSLKPYGPTTIPIEVFLPIITIRVTFPGIICIRTTISIRTRHCSSPQKYKELIQPSYFFCLFDELIQSDDIPELLWTIIKLS